MFEKNMDLIYFGGEMKTLGKKKEPNGNSQTKKKIQYLKQKVH